MCPSCGKPTRAGAAFCGECGFKLSTVVVDPMVTVTPVVEKPLLRPPPPPPAAAPLISEAPLAPAVVGVTPPLIPDGAPVRLVPPPPGFIAVPPPSIEPPAASIGIPSSESVDETRLSVRRKVGAHWRLVLPDARQAEVGAALLVGRDPSANRNWPGASLLTIDDDAHSVSKTHAVFEVDGDGLWITDLHSTNGVIITQPDGTELDIDPDARTAVQPGADVELGDYVVQVEKD